MSHYYSEKQDSALDLKKIKIRIKDIELEFYTGSGVFSKKKLDKGTEVLLEHCIADNDWKILDIGCGIGVVGIVLKKRYPQAKIEMTDINERAVKLAKMNVKLHKLDNTVYKSDLFKNIPGQFDTIIANPPQTAGKQVCFDLIEQSKKHLTKDGTLQLVARHKKGGEQLSLKMQEVFGNVDVLGIKSGFRVYISKN
ncbi:MAG: class I SAM-dependent methyltransferase [archaeon]